MPATRTVHDNPPRQSGAEQLASLNAQRTRILFSSSVTAGPSMEEGAFRAQLGSKVGSEWAWAQKLPSALLNQQSTRGSDAAGSHGTKRKASSTVEAGQDPAASGQLVPSSSAPTSDALVAFRSEENLDSSNNTRLSTALVRKKELESRQEQPAFHPQWRLMRVISGHYGWVRSIAVEPNNQWFATGAGDHMIKIWDLASGELKLSLTGHKSTVRGLAVSSRHPYLFSAGEDKEVKCWDLETNKVIRKYGGHKSGIYCLALHPTLDVLVSGGRDSVARVWDMRTRAQIHLLAGHTGTVASTVCQEADPQIITGSMDQTVRLWDLVAGKTYKTLTQHHKSVRALALHPTQYSFASGSAAGRNIKTWKCPEGTLLNSMQHDAIVNTLACNADGVLFSGGDNGMLKFFDYDTGMPFQAMDDVVQPGSLQSEAGVFASAFDQSGTRLITGCGDKTIKVYREVA